MKAVAAVSTSSAVFQSVQQIRIVVGKVGHQTVELAGQASKALSKINGISAQILFDRWICKNHRDHIHIFRHCKGQNGNFGSLRHGK
mgnify:CR=1 FL=1